MIAGTFVLENQSIQFHLTRSGLIEYTVHDAISGVAATKAVDMEEFSAAVYIALLDGDNASDRMYELATSAMPRVKDIHDRSEMSPAEALEAAGNLRWIP